MMGMFILIESHQNRTGKFSTFITGIDILVLATSFDTAIQTAQIVGI
jgi:hypothetical protein